VDKFHKDLESAECRFQRGGRSEQGALPERGEVVRIVAGELVGEEAMVEDVRRVKDSERVADARTVVDLRVWGVPRPVEDPAYVVLRYSPPMTRGGANGELES
jgi:transcription antitermination factor NusG